MQICELNSDPFSDLFGNNTYFNFMELLMLKMLDQLQQPLQLKMHAYRIINSAIENIPIPTNEI